MMATTFEDVLLAVGLPLKQYYWLLRCECCDEVGCIAEPDTGQPLPVVFATLRKANEAQKNSAPNKQPHRVSIAKLVEEVMRFDGLCTFGDGDTRNFVVFQKKRKRKSRSKKMSGKPDEEKDDQWIIDHADELKAEILKAAKEGKPKPKEGTLLGRALELFTTPPAE